MVRIAHVGHGYWGRNIARNMAELGYLCAVADPDVAAAEAAAAKYGVPAPTIEAVLAATDIDAVSIASPAGLHYEQARAALQAGKHVFVEKPLALKVEQAEALCTLADHKGLILMVGHLLQYHPVYIRLREMVHGGELGTIRHVYSNRLSLGKFRNEENVLWSFAPHDISMILGLVRAEPESVTAQGTSSFLPGIADLVTVQMHFEEGVGAHVFASWMHPFKEHRLVVIGEKAMAVFEDSRPEWDDKLIIYRHTIDTTGPVPLPAKTEGERIAVPQAEPLKEECRTFAAAIENGTQPPSDGREGVRVLRVLDRAEQALRHYLQSKAQ